MKLIVVGGSGYLGARVVRQALLRGHSVTSISRSGGPPAGVTPAAELEGAEWVAGDATVPEVQARVGDADGVITTLGVFGTNERMRAVNGDANIAIARAAAAGGVKRFVHVSAAEYGVIEGLIPGYFEGKRAADAEVARLFGSRGTVLRPGMVHGTRQAGPVQLPLWLLGAPLEAVGASQPGTALRAALGRFGGVLTPAIGVDTARAAGPVVELFWDGGCPLCRREIGYYQRLDVDGRVAWTDIDAAPEALQPHGVSQEEAMARIHAIGGRGQLLSGVPAFLAVWEQLPYWRLLPPLLTAAPGAVPLAEAAYRLFARHRLTVTGRRSLGAATACRPPSAAAPAAGSAEPK
ncbi:hypothetical protein EMIHUDRAFT_455836 [Emiliania huxleyi CCMP1516]|uniref:NAD(P)-binding domain-containing protein n=2 Tax=Emiliania huxleyi TaxID=2903 RepID=A0A0D3KCF6_EMIH1|nr:hypothetical protein EMIHUDRAFT_455836 [Emiliania huxleyi CCMP1516]EOD33441.1 hypothetical protein EMIHUDRAFT_455836 [Emiliania huxleyi CCMP1516]|eukprot:XP_005785870.1 hypothetical protein EMIHUDRAFT_455836 [Emiliania huxleyi CCMP1516]